MSLLIAALKLDVTLQARSGLYAIGVVVALIMGLAGRFVVAPEYAGRVLAVFYVAGLGGTTYMIAAALTLLEKTGGTLQALRVTPLTATVYITSKVITLTSFAALESAIVFGVAFFGISMNPAPMIIGVLCLGVIFTLVGLGQAAAHDSVTAFLFPGAVIITGVMQMPVFYVIASPELFWYLIPTQGPLLLMLAATEPLETWQWAYAIITSSASMALAFWWARSRFAQFIALQED